jgi:hypothetical protein
MQHLQRVAPSASRANQPKSPPFIAEPWSVEYCIASALKVSTFFNNSFQAVSQFLLRQPTLPV